MTAALMFIVASAFATLALIPVLSLYYQKIILPQRNIALNLIVLPALALWPSAMAYSSVVILNTLREYQYNNFAMLYVLILGVLVMWHLKVYPMVLVCLALIVLPLI